MAIQNSSELGKSHVTTFIAEVRDGPFASKTPRRLSCYLSSSVRGDEYKTEQGCQREAATFAVIHHSNSSVIVVGLGLNIPRERPS